MEARPINVRCPGGLGSSLKGAATILSAGATAAAAGLISFAFGLFLIYEIGFADGGLFTDAPKWQPR